MAVDLEALTNEYNQLVELSKTDNQAAANRAVMSYAQNMPAILEELRTLRNGAIDALPHLTTTDDACTIQ